MIPRLSDDCGAGRVRPDRRNEYTITENALRFFYEFVTDTPQSYKELDLPQADRKESTTEDARWTPGACDLASGGSHGLALTGRTAGLESMLASGQGSAQAHDGIGGLSGTPTFASWPGTSCAYVNPI